jgi:predicted RNA polymerase sigma factor
MTGTREAVERIFREEHGRILAGLIGQCRDFDLAEDALQDALAGGRARPLAVRGRAGKPGRLDHDRRAAQGHRPAAT